MKIYETYPGGKGSNGTYQTIINLIPPCRTLIIPFLGNCAILRNIKLPPEVIAIDKDTAVIEKWKSNCNSSGIIFINGDGTQYLKNIPDHIDNSGTVVYCDPPYLIDSRKSKRNIYKFELDENSHQDLLSTIKALRSRVLISSLENNLYLNELSKWNHITFMNKIRTGMQKEFVFYNFNNSMHQLQDYRYLGQNFREREIIKRKLNRWNNKFKNLSAYEKNAMIELLSSSIIDIKSV